MASGFDRFVDHVARIDLKYRNLIFTIAAIAFLLALAGILLFALACRKRWR